MYFDRKVNSTNHANSLFFTIRNLSWFSYPNEPFIPDFLTFIYIVTAGFLDHFSWKNWPYKRVESFKGSSSNLKALSFYNKVFKLGRHKFVFCKHIYN